MREEEIRPQAIFDEYLRLAAEDTINFFSDVQRQDCPCPACGASGDPSIHKYGFVYEQCKDCLTLFVNPRPVASAFARFYTESASSKYWATTFYSKTASARKEKLWRPKAQMVADLLRDYSLEEKSTIVDIGGGYGLFAEEIRNILNTQPIVIEPAPHLAAVCRNKNLIVVEKFLENVTARDLSADHSVFVSFELFEHLHDPARFLGNLRLLMCPNDLFIFTTLSSTGVDIQALWEDSKSIMPPHHLNFFNPHSIEILLKYCGFEMVDVSTPGKLDIDILTNNSDKIKDRFWKTVIARSTGEERQRWQDFISSSGWSSHMMIVCRKSVG